MINGFETISIQVASLKQALASYTPLLGDFTITDSSAVRDLKNVRIKLVETHEIEAAQIESLSIWDENRTPGPIDSGELGIALSSVDRRTLNPTESDSGITSVDHIVLMTNRSEACVALFGETLGIRMALDQLVPEWGGRMLFFRAGKMTLEVIHNLEKPPEGSRFWGITYLCEDIDKTMAWLDQSNIEHSRIRDGRKRGTRVATLKSHNLGLPTLLIEPAASSVSN